MSQLLFFGIDAKLPVIPLLSSFPRRQESMQRIHLSAITTAQWVPAFVGMTKKK
ncbi:MAG: hypothetical protein LBE78_01315 [Burkholderiaceae bacterium]|jgi:hypothetical protein|nr:hypothetical protein [Burkholderiaceae bacterium]